MNKTLLAGLSYLLAELLTGALLFGRSVQEHFALYRDLSYSLGLAAQIGFALMPTLLLLRRPVTQRAGVTR